MVQLQEVSRTDTREMPILVMVINMRTSDYVDLMPQFRALNLTGNQIGVEPRAIEDGLRKGVEAVILLVEQWSSDAASLCTKISEGSDSPIVVIAGTMTEDERVAALLSGADDCMAQPLGWKEFDARLRAHVRRVRQATHIGRREINLGELSIDARSMRATMAGKALSLTSFEFDLLKVFAQRAGHVLSREFLISTMRGRDYGAFDRSIDVHVSRLRGKLGDDSRNPRWLKTVRGAGYLMVQQDS